MILSNWAISNRITVLVLVVGIVFAGVLSYVTLPREASPDVNLPYVLITTAHVGVAPDDVESTITNEIEKKLTGLKGMKEVTSTTQEGLSLIKIEFASDVDIDDALQRVKDKVDLAKPELPSNTDEPVEPVVTEFNFSELPILQINVSGTISPVRLKYIAEELEDYLETISGVLEVDVLGALEREIIVEMDPDRVAEYGLSIPELLELIPGENVNQSAGGLETAGTKFNVRIQEEFADPAEIDKLVLTMRGERPIYLTDVATVRDTFKDRESISRMDGRPSITVAVKKRIGANVIEIAQKVQAFVAEFQRRSPAGVRFEIVDDRSEEIFQMVADLENNILSGLILVILVLFAFLGIRSSLIVATAIPLSMLISFAVLDLLDVTLNMVVLFALILALGMLVDNAIVIVENISRYMELGYPRLEAARKGTAEVAWPVIASTGTTVAAFGPLLFWPDVMGDFMKYIPITVIVVLCSSLFVALVINPVICSIFARPTRRRDGDVMQSESRTILTYRRVLDLALHHPAATLSLAGLLLVGIAGYFVKHGSGVELFPSIDPNQAIISIRAPQGTNIYRTDEIVREVESRIEPMRYNEHGQKRFDYLISTIGSAGSFNVFTNEVGGPHNATVQVIFPDYEDRVDDDGTAWTSAEVVQRIRARLGDIPGAEIKVEKQEEGPPTGQAVTVRIIGEDLKTLKRLSDRAKRKIETVPNLVNLRSDLEAEKPELYFEIDRRRAMLLGVNTATIAQYVKTAIFGTKVSSYRQFNDEYDIRIRVPEEDRDDIEDVLRLEVPNRRGEAVPISSLGTLVYRPGLGDVYRIDRKRVVTLTADAEGRLGPEVLADAQERLATLDLPPGYTLEYAGEKEEQDEASAFLGRAFLIALLLITGILVAQFNTLAVPAIILFTVVMSTIGVFVGLLVFDMPFGIIMTGVGVISLAGVVVNNAIVLLDYTRQLQRRGKDLMSAAVEAGATRLRPVLLTATTTIIGLIPLATGASFDFHPSTFGLAERSSTSQWWASMAWAVIFGLAFATVLTLVVVPSMYVAIYRLLNRFGLGGLQHADEKQAAARDDLILEDY